MSGNNYIINADNLFDDVDDETFLKNSSNPAIRDMEEQKRVFQEKRREIENRTLESSQRSLQMLVETEQIGTGTAEELARQREQLEKTNQNLEQINTNLRFSQKHINGIKSVFGGLKNYLSGTKDLPNKSSPSNNTSDKPKIENLKSPTSPMSPEERYNSHPVNRLRNDDDIDVVQAQKSQRSVDEQLNSNLDVIAGSVSRLKYLAMDLGQEIESSNDLLDEINDKMEVADVRINKQNKEMNKLLGKK